MDTTARTPPGDAAIDIDDEASLQHWMRFFGVTQEQLEEAVQAAGSKASDVHRHLLDAGASAGAG